MKTAGFTGHTKAVRYPAERVEHYTQSLKDRGTVDSPEEQQANYKIPFSTSEALGRMAGSSDVFLKRLAKESDPDKRAEIEKELGRLQQEFFPFFVPEEELEKIRDAAMVEYGIREVIEGRMGISTPEERREKKDEIQKKADDILGAIARKWGQENNMDVYPRGKDLLDYRKNSSEDVEDFAKIAEAKTQINEEGDPPEAIADRLKNKLSSVNVIWDTLGMNIDSEGLRGRFWYDFVDGIYRDVPQGYQLGIQVTEVTYQEKFKGNFPGTNIVAKPNEAGGSAFYVLVDTPLSSLDSDPRNFGEITVDNRIQQGFDLKFQRNIEGKRGDMAQSLSEKEIIGFTVLPKSPTASS